MISIRVKHVGCNLLMWLRVVRPQYEINYTSRGVLNKATHDDLHMTRSLWLLRDVPSGNYHSLLCCNDDISCTETSEESNSNVNRTTQVTNDRQRNHSQFISEKSPEYFSNVAKRISQDISSPFWLRCLKSSLCDGSMVVNVGWGRIWLNNSSFCPLNLWSGIYFENIKKPFEILRLAFD
jgi:hypothetical protein